MGEVSWKHLVESWLSDVEVSDKPCDECGVAGQSRLYIDMHVFCLCAACAWTLTEEYHAVGHIAPWEVHLG